MCNFAYAAWGQARNGRKKRGTVLAAALKNLTRQKRFGCSRLLCLLVFVFISPILFAHPGSAKYASIVIDSKSGRILHSVNADTLNYPASLTKMMTLYLLFKALKEKRLSLDSNLRVSARATRQPASRLGLRKDQAITVRQAILAIVTKSANDVATVIAESLASNERNFALLMTARARQIGMRRTTFRNASGLSHRGQLSTARDMSTLARRLLLDFPHYYQFFATRGFTYGGVRHRNHNKLLTTYQGADGIKTGYIRASGYNLVASAQRNGRRLIGVIFGGRSSKARNHLMANLLNKGFRLNAPARLASTGQSQQGSLLTAGGSRQSYPQWGIQIGAYKRFSPAYEIARKAVEKAPILLAQGTIKVVPLRQSKGKSLYLGRVLGISKTQAYKACRILRQQKINCMELRMKKKRAVG